MRNLCAAVAAAALISTGAFAASGNDGQLAPGKPAGVQQAQTGNQVVMVVAGVAILGMAVALVSGGSSGNGAGGNNNNQGGNPTTSGTV